MEKIRQMKGDFLLDSDILIDLMRGYQPAREFIEEAEEINLSIFTKFELINGARNKRELHHIEKMVENTNILYATGAAQKEASQLISRYHLSKGISIPDSLIAATAMDYGLTLVTRNAKHFDFIDSLDTYTPY